MFQLGAFRRNCRKCSRPLVKASRGYIDANSTARFEESLESRSDPPECHRSRLAESLTWGSRANSIAATVTIFLSRSLETIVQGLFDAQFIDDSDLAQKLVWILGLPHFHHHEKRSVTKTASSISLSKQGLHPSPSFVMSNLARRGSSSSLSDQRRSTPLARFSLDDEPDNGQEMSATRLIGKSSSHDMALPEQEEASSAHQPSAKVGKERFAVQTKCPLLLGLQHEVAEKTQP